MGSSIFQKIFLSKKTTYFIIGFLIKRSRKRNYTTYQCTSRWINILRFRALHQTEV